MAHRCLIEIVLRALSCFNGAETVAEILRDMHRLREVLHLLIDYLFFNLYN